MDPVNETLIIKGAGTGLFAQESMFEEPAPEQARPAFRRQSHASADKPGASLMSDKQKALLRTMLGERVNNPAVAPIREKLNRCREGGMLTTGVFSECFDALKAIPRDEVTSEATEQAAPVNTDLDLVHWDGRYTLEKDTGHRTFRITVQKSDADFAPGETVIEYLSGPNNSDDYTSFGFVKPGSKVIVWKKHRQNLALVADVEAFVAVWQRVAADDSDAVDFIEALDDNGVLATRRCRRCGEDLSVPESVRQGFGPVCIRRGLN